MSERGVYGKYIVAKADGTPVDSDACYFVLRLDDDYAARLAARAYAAACCNPTLAEDVERCCDWLDNPPECTCGGRDWDVRCPFHDDDTVWRHGGHE